LILELQNQLVREKAQKDILKEILVLQGNQESMSWKNLL